MKYIKKTELKLCPECMKFGRWVHRRCGDCFQKFQLRKQKREQKREGFWHYKRTCLFCGNQWAGLHCPHDGYQNPCPKCNEVPRVVTGDCNCEFNI